MPGEAEGGGWEIYEVMQKDAFSFASHFLFKFPKASLWIIHRCGARRRQWQPGVGSAVGAGGVAAPPGAGVAGAGAAELGAAGVPSVLSKVLIKLPVARHEESSANFRWPFTRKETSWVCCHPFPRLPLEFLCSVARSHLGNGVRAVFKVYLKTNHRIVEVGRDL